MPWFLRSLLLILLGGGLSLGCKKIPAGRDAVVGLSVRGVPRAVETKLEAGIATKESSRFLAVFPGFYDWKTFDEAALEADVTRIERELKRAGYYEARVQATRVIRVAENKLKIEIEVEAGPRITVEKLKLEGLSALPFEAAMHATRSVSLKLGDPFDETAYEQAKLDLANALADVGYAHVLVKGQAKVRLATRGAELTLSADPGPQTRLGEVRIEGLQEIPEKIVRQTLRLRTGQTYSRRELGDARAALFRLGVFSRVDVVPSLTNRSAEVIPITVKVKEGALRSISASGGATFDVLRFAARGRIAWSHRNFLGGLRKLTLSTRPGLTFYPTNLYNITWPTDVLPENSLTVSLEQPGLFDGRTTGILSSSYNVYPLLYPSSSSSEQTDDNGMPPPAPVAENVVGYNELAERVGLEHSYLSGRLPVSLSANWRANFPFTYKGETVEGLHEVIVAYPELELMYDLRDDPIAPTKGIVLQNNLQVALPVLGSKIFDVRIRPEVRAYVPLDFRKRLVLALRYTMGFLFTSDYGDALARAGSGDLNYSDPAVINDQHTLLFRAFYSGGPTSNRGYPFQRIGPQGTIGFLVPSQTACQQADLPPECLQPLGGFNLWEASLELRYNLTGPWGIVAFADTSDVGLQGQAFDYTAPHLSVGAGFRYASPIGPVRFDIGYRVPGMQKLTDTPGDPPDISEIEPYASEEWGGTAIHIAIGEAF